MSHAHWLVRIAECILYDDLVAPLTKNDSNAWPVIRVPQLLINRGG
jgi:hypothetical protein